MGVASSTRLVPSPWSILSGCPEQFAACSARRCSSRSRRTSNPNVESKSRCRTAPRQIGVYNDQKWNLKGAKIIGKTNSQNPKAPFLHWLMINQSNQPASSIDTLYLTIFLASFLSRFLRLENTQSHSSNHPLVKFVCCFFLECSGVLCVWCLQQDIDQWPSALSFCVQQQIAPTVSQWCGPFTLTINHSKKPRNPVENESISQPSQITSMIQLFNFKSLQTRRVWTLAVSNVISASPGWSSKGLVLIW